MHFYIKPLICCHGQLCPQFSKAKHLSTAQILLTSRAEVKTVEKVSSAFNHCGKTAERGAEGKLQAHE